MGIFRFLYVLDRTTRSSPEYKGKVGEARVSFIVNRLIKQKGGYLINDIVLPINKDRTTQIDHIYVSKYGVFVIETKAYQGLIYGKENDENWYIYFGGQKYEMYNPVAQNKLHIAAVNTCISSLKTPPVSLVTILRANISHISAKNVYNLPGLERYLLNLKDEVMSDEEVENIYKEIKYFKENPPKTMKEFVEEVKA